MVNFRLTLHALAETILRDLHCNGEEISAHALGEVVGFLSGQHARMTDFLRLPFKCVVLLFDAWSLPWTGRPFHRLSHTDRQEQFRKWKNSRLALRRDLIRFFETMTVFCWYSERYKQEPEPPR